jgi:RND superfamily putative drug exporter
VIIDATIVRCLLVPALMVLMGKLNWYMPRWLDSVVPHVSIEGAEFFAERDRLASESPALPTVLSTLPETVPHAH